MCLRPRFCIFDLIRSVHSRALSLGSKSFFWLVLCLRPRLYSFELIRSVHSSALSLGSKSFVWLVLCLRPRFCILKLMRSVHSSKRIFPSEKWFVYSQVLNIAYEGSKSSLEVTWSSVSLNGCTTFRLHALIQIWHAHAFEKCCNIVSHPQILANFFSYSQKMLFNAFSNGLWCINKI